MQRLERATVAFVVVSTPLPWEKDDGGRAATNRPRTDRDCVTRSIAIGAGRSYDEIHAMVDAAGEHVFQVDDAAETGTDLTLADYILLKRLIWRTVEEIRYRPGGAHLTVEDLRPDLHPVLILKTFVIVPPVAHLTVMVDGVIRDLEGIADATGHAKSEFVVEEAFAPPAKES
jgi:hypothetical protein